MIKEVDQRSLKKNLSELRSGYTVRVSQKIKEGEKERVQVFEGVIIKINAGFGINKTITVRKVVDGIGVEKIFPVHSPNVVSIDVTKKSKVRRAKLYYLREKDHKKLYEEKKVENSKIKA